MNYIDQTEWLSALFVKSHADDFWIEAYAVKHDRETTEVLIEVAEGASLSTIRLSIEDARKMAAYILDGTRDAA